VKAQQCSSDTSDFRESSRIGAATYMYKIIPTTDGQRSLANWKSSQTQKLRFFLVLVELLVMPHNSWKIEKSQNRVKISCEIRVLLHLRPKIETAFI
jgi:hypothetical protein